MFAMHAAHSTGKPFITDVCVLLRDVAMGEIVVDTAVDQAEETTNGIEAVMMTDMTEAPRPETIGDTTADRLRLGWMTGAAILTEAMTEVPTGASQCTLIETTAGTAGGRSPGWPPHGWMKGIATTAGLLHAWIMIREDMTAAGRLAMIAPTTGSCSLYIN
mmetsp:Transcript_19441/g.30431  ORF Transcript_19441/g.30431 Transcript_19441/m.30431 type:complete len:161 (-) Transcript_19441:1359-1841(-)